jgi:hypothetical protein
MTQGLNFVKKKKRKFVTIPLTGPKTNIDSEFCEF